MERIVDVFMGKAPFLNLLNDQEKFLLISKAKNVVFEKDTVIFQKGDQGSTLYVITKGKIKITLPSSDRDKEAIVAILSDGEMFGELSVFDNKPRSANATAIDETQTIVINKKDLYQAMKDIPSMAQKILAALSMRLRQADCLVEDACFFDLPARLSRRLLDLAERHGKPIIGGIEIPLRLTQQDFAGMIGATRESVNKQLRLCQERGVIAVENHRIIILKPDELKKRIY